MAADAASARAPKDADGLRTRYAEFSWNKLFFGGAPQPNGCTPPVYEYGKYVGQDPDPNIRAQASAATRTPVIRLTAPNRAWPAHAEVRAGDAERDRVSSSAVFDLEAGTSASASRGDRAVMAGATRPCPRWRDACSSAPSRCRDRRRRTSPWLERCAARTRAPESEPRRNDSTTGSVILPSRKSSPTFLPSLARFAAVVERVVDQLEGDAEIHAVRAAGGDSPGPSAPRAPDPPRQAAANSSAVLARITAR